MSADKSERALENAECLRRAGEILVEQFEQFGDAYHACKAGSECANFSKELRKKYEVATAETQRASNTALALATALEGYLLLVPEAINLGRAAVAFAKKEGHL